MMVMWSFRSSHSDLRRNRLDCDCHLQWLAVLLNMSLTQPDVEGADCGTGASAPSITDASVDFSTCQGRVTQVVSLGPSDWGIG